MVVKRPFRPVANFAQQPLFYSSILSYTNMYLANFQTNIDKLSQQSVNARMICNILRRQTKLCDNPVKVIILCLRNLDNDFSMISRYLVNNIIVKGQIISEQICGVLNFLKKQRNYCQNFCPSL